MTGTGKEKARGVWLALILTPHYDEVHCKIQFSHIVMVVCPSWC